MIARRIINRLERMLQRRFWDPLTGLFIFPFRRLERIGSDYGGWTLPEKLLDRDSICYCIGTGEDITFDLGLIERFQCNVFAYDPTPRAIVYAAKIAGRNPLYHFFPIGVSNRDERLKFYAPSNPEHVSHSIVNLQRTDRYFEADCKRLSVLMNDNGHERLDLLKLDIEGAEYQVLNSVIEDKLNVGVICVEFDELHHHLDENYLERIREMIDRLRSFGYVLTVAERSNYTFIKPDLLPFWLRLFV